MTTSASEYAALLAEIQNSNITTYTTVPTTEPRFSINANTRAIEVPSEFTFLGVRNDHKAETIYFEIDRYFDDVDLSEHTCVIQFLNKNASETKEGVYPITTMDVDSVDGKIVFGWNICNDATQLSGDIVFSVRFYSIDENGLFTYNFNTLSASSIILETLNTTNSSEIITSSELEIWNAKMESMASIIESDIKTVEEKIEELENSIASIPEDYTALTEEVSQLSSEIDEFTEISNNLHNKNTDVTGFLNHGVIAESDNYITTDYIPIEYGVTYYFSNDGVAVDSRFINFFSSDKVHLEDYEMTNQYSVTTPNNDIKFMRITYKKHLDKFQIEVNKVSPYVPYGRVVKNVSVIGLDDIQETQEKVIELSETYLLKEYNLFNKDTVTIGQYIDNTGNIIEDTNGIWSLSDYIPLSKGATYIKSDTHYALYFDNNKNVVGMNGLSDDILTIPYNGYVRLNVKLSLLDSYMVVKGDTLPINYVPYGRMIDGEKVNYPDFIVDKYKKSRFYGKKVAWYGTSITKGYAWCDIVNNAFNFDATNCGVGGTAICLEEGKELSSMCTQSRMLGQYNDVTDPNTGEVTTNGVAIPPDVEVIFVEGGTNDWARNWEIGTKEFSETPNNQTFGGACHQMFDNLTTLFPNAEIIVVGSPFGKMANRDIFTNKYGVLNNNNLQTVDYGDILLEIASKWGIKGTNIGREMQVHDNNVASIIPDGLHLTTEEAQTRASNATINYLLTLEN